MSLLKNMPRGAWLIAGAVIAVLLLPTGVGAKAPKLAGIILGTSGNKADVATTGQLLTGEANPSSFFTQQTALTAASPANAAIAIPPAGQSLVVKSVHLDQTISGNAEAFLFVGPASGSSCSSQTQFERVDSISGLAQVNFDPGVVVPGGDALCENDQVGNITTSVYGYLVPAAEAPSFAAPRH